MRLDRMLLHTRENAVRVCLGYMSYVHDLPQTYPCDAGLQRPAHMRLPSWKCEQVWLKI